MDDRGKVTKGDRLFIPVTVVDDRDRGAIVLEVGGRQFHLPADVIEEVGRYPYRERERPRWPTPPEDPPSRAAEAESTLDRSPQQGTDRPGDPQA